MKAEAQLVSFIHDTRFAEIPLAALKTVKHQVLAVIGTTIAGATADGCETAVQLYRELGGKQEATILVHGGRIPAQDAAFVNGVMARALDFCDALAPGPHPGSAVIPAALAASELAGQCSGQEFITAVAIGTEVAARLNLSEAAYDGFDPTGICVPFGAAAAAARILGLSQKEIWNALALAFNSCGGSFQSHIDGSLGVRFVQGRVAQSGVMSPAGLERNHRTPEFPGWDLWLLSSLRQGYMRWRDGSIRSGKQISSSQACIQEVPELCTDRGEH